MTAADLDGTEPFMQITRDPIKKAGYIPILVMGMGLMFARLLLMAKLLPVAEFADLSAALVVSSMFNMLSCLGLFVDLQRRLPVLLARNQNRQAASELLRPAIIAIALFLAFLVFLGVIMTVSGARLILAFGLLQGLSQQLFMIASTESRSGGDPLRYSMQFLLRSVPAIILDALAAVAVSSAIAVLIAEFHVLAFWLRPSYSVWRVAGQVFLLPLRPGWLCDRSPAWSGRQ